MQIRSSKPYVQVKLMLQLPEINELEKALAEAGSAHHEFEKVVLEGFHDELWPGFYAAYVLGKLGNFTRPSVLSGSNTFNTHQ